MCAAPRQARPGASGLVCDHPAATGERCGGFGGRFLIEMSVRDFRADGAGMGGVQPLMVMGRSSRWTSMGARDPAHTRA